MVNTDISSLAVESHLLRLPPELCWIILEELLSFDRLPLVQKPDFFKQQLPIGAIGLASTCKQLNRDFHFCLRRQNLIIVQFTGPRNFLPSQCIPVVWQQSSREGFAKQYPPHSFWIHVEISWHRKSCLRMPPIRSAVTPAQYDAWSRLVRSTFLCNIAPHPLEVVTSDSERVRANDQWPPWSHQRHRISIDIAASSVNLSVSRLVRANLQTSLKQFSIVKADRIKFDGDNIEGTDRSKQDTQTQVMEVLHLLEGRLSRFCRMLRFDKVGILPWDKSGRYIPFQECRSIVTDCATFISLLRYTIEREQLQHMAYYQSLRALLCRACLNIATIFPAINPAHYLMNPCFKLRAGSTVCVDYVLEKVADLRIRPDGRPDDFPLPWNEWLQLCHVMTILHSPRHIHGRVRINRALTHLRRLRMVAMLHPGCDMILQRIQVDIRELKIGPQPSEIFQNASVVWSHSTLRRENLLLADTNKPENERLVLFHRTHLKNDTGNPLNGLVTAWSYQSMD